VWSRKGICRIAGRVKSGGIDGKGGQEQCGGRKRLAEKGTLDFSTNAGGNHDDAGNRLGNSAAVGVSSRYRVRPYYRDIWDQGTSIVENSFSHIMK